VASAPPAFPSAAAAKLLHTAAALHPSADVADAVAAVCKSLGRPYSQKESKLAATLRDNWFETAQDVANMQQVERTAKACSTKYRQCMQYKAPADAGMYCMSNSSELTYLPGSAAFMRCTA
jgi:pyruvate/oxaloacetate carboxyltransferase